MIGHFSNVKILIKTKINRTNDKGLYSNPQDFRINVATYIKVLNKVFKP